MKILGNLIWLIFGGLPCALGYFVGSLFLAITIIGLPLAWKTLQLGILCLWPFGAKVTPRSSMGGCLNTFFNIVWILVGGIWTCLCHLGFGALLCITIIGIPWGKQHFKMASFALAPFGLEINWR